MNFGILKNMVENLVQGYTCPFCQSKSIAESNIDIIWAAGNTVNIDMHCPSCKRHFMAKTEVVQMDLWNVTADALGQIQKSLQALKGKLWGDIEIEAEVIKKKAEPKILDENIVNLKKWMAWRDFSVEDLFGKA